MEKQKTEIKICITGGRDYDKPNLIQWIIYQLKLRLPKRDFDVTLIHGAAKGVDTFAELEARKDFYNGTIGLAWKTRPYPVLKEDWEKYGLQAGPRRNKIMLTEEQPHVLISFPGGKGTANCVGTAIELDIPVISFYDAPRLTLFAKIDECVRKIFSHKGPETSEKILKRHLTP